MSTFKRPEVSRYDPSKALKAIPEQSQVVAVELYTLSPVQYRTLEDALPAFDSRVTDPIQAGIQIGIQLTLKALRDGFTATR